jgi:hypothetical protein
MRLRLLGFITFLFLGLIAFLLLAEAAPAQQVSPVMSECSGKRCSGQFTATNLNPIPAVVTVQAVSFKPGQGNQELDPKIHFELRDMAARLGPKGQHTFYWKAECDELPCYFAIYASFSPAKQDKKSTGLFMTICLPTTVWMCERSKDCRLNTRKEVFHDGQ